MTESVLCSRTPKLTREELARIPAPAPTPTHKTIPHIEVVNALVETLGFRHIAPVREEYAVSTDGMKMFGVMDLETGFTGARFSLGLRNANDKSMRLALVVGYRVFCCDNMAFNGDFTPVLAKHTKHFDLVSSLSVGVDQMQRNFEPMMRQVDLWQRHHLTDDRARLVIYEAFVEGRLEAPRHLSRRVHSLYFDPPYPEFAPRTLWSLSNAFTSALKDAEPIPQFRATAALGPFLERYQ
jgi:hypothetical protein